MRTGCMSFVFFFPGVTDHSYHAESDCMIIKGECKDSRSFKEAISPYTVMIIPDIKRTYDYYKNKKEEYEEPKLKKLGQDCDDAYQGYRFICDKDNHIDCFDFSSTDELQSLIKLIIKNRGEHRFFSGLEISSDYEEYHNRAEKFFYDMAKLIKGSPGIFW